MSHYTETFAFINKAGKEVELESVPYSIEIEDDVLVKRFGREALDSFAKTHTLNYKITLEHIKEDFPKLLSPGSAVKNIDWRKQAGKYYDEMKRVYYFFLEYDSNAQLRQLESLKTTTLSSIEALKKILTSTPESILAQMNTPIIIGK
jgi:hypothetical protein